MRPDKLRRGREIVQADKKNVEVVRMSAERWEAEKHLHPGMSALLQFGGDVWIANNDGRPAAFTMWNGD